jgi:hypothetical protein
MYKQFKTDIHKSDVLSLLRFLNNRPMDAKDKKRVKKFFTQLRGELAQYAINESDLLKALIPKGNLHTVNTPIK